jgi:hypothetical protein
VNREINRLAVTLDSIDGPWPAWDEPVGDRDIAVDQVTARALALGSGGLHALGAAVSRRRLPVLYRFSVRAAARALSGSDLARCQAALAAAVIASWDEREPRELMINFAPFHVAATRIGGDTAALFDWAASQAGADAAETLRLFGLRTDLTLEAFGWKEVTTTPGEIWFALGR